MADTTIDLQFLARQGRQVLDELTDMRREFADMRDDRTVMVAILNRLDATVNSLSAEMRAMRGQFDRLRNDVRGGIRERLEALEKGESAMSGLTAIETRLSVLTWMVGTHIALSLPIIWLLLRVAGKVGAI